MPTFNAQTSDIGNSGVAHVRTNIRFRHVNTSLNDLVAGGFVSSVVRQGIGIHLATLTNFSPVAFVGGSAGILSGSQRAARIGQVVINNTTKVVLVTIYVQTATGTPALVDATGGDVVLVNLQWKMFSGVDSSGL